MVPTTLLLICAVAAGDVDWRSVPDKATNRDRTGSAGARGDADRFAANRDSGRSHRWTEIEDALEAPDEGAGQASNYFPRLRPADGSDPPPKPPNPMRDAIETQPGQGGFDALRSRNLGQALPDPPGLIDVDADDRSATNARDGHFDRTSDPNDRDVLFERRWPDESIGDKQYITPPPRQFPDEQAIGSGGVVPLPRQVSRPPDDAAPSNRIRPLPENDSSVQAGNDAPAAAAAAADQPGSESDDRQPTATAAWWPLTITMLALFASLGFNAYLGWIAWDIHGRFNDVVDEAQELERQLDDPSARSDVREDLRQKNAMRGMRVASAPSH